MNARLLAAATALLAALSLLPSAARADEITAAPPKFAETTKGPVLLRYVFKPGATFDSTADAASEMNVQAIGQQMSIPVQIKTSFSCSVEQVTPEGNARISMVITRLVMSAGGPMPAQYDSDVDKAPAQAGLKPLVAMMHQKVFCTVTPRGEISGIDLHLMKQALDQIGEASKSAVLEEDVTETLQSAFAQFAANPVSVGDIFDGGTLNRVMEGIGTMSIGVRYEVEAISADQKNVVLKPLTKFDIQMGPGSPFHVESASADGWLLFNRDRGNVDRAYNQAKIELSGTPNNQKATMTLGTTLKYVCADHAAGGAAAKEPAPKAPQP
jgi:hypothetical protein